VLQQAPAEALSSPLLDDGEIGDAPYTEMRLHVAGDVPDDGAVRLGELGIGTNFQIDRGTREVLLDEKIGGTVHMALGRSYPETGGVNESAVHEDLVCDLRGGGKITVDGEDLQVDGKFAV